MYKLDFTALVARFADDQIEWRISDFTQAARDTETVIIPYLQATAIRNRLDTLLGQENWTSEIQHIPNGMICKLSIRINGEWVSKSDCSQETKEFSSMGASTRAFVRAAAVWGIGRYLYEMPVFYADYVVEGTPNSRPIYFGDKTFFHIPPSLNGEVKQQKPKAAPRPTSAPAAKNTPTPVPRFDNAPLGTKSQVDSAKPTELALVSYIPNVTKASVKPPVVVPSGVDGSQPLPDAGQRPWADEKMRSCRTKGLKFKDHTAAQLANLVQFFTVECPFPTSKTTIGDKQRLVDFLGGSLEIPKMA